MESTQFWGVQERESIETAVESALKSLKLLNKKFSHETSANWYADNVEISLSVYSSVIEHMLSPGVASAVGNYQLIVFPFNPAKEYKSTIQSIYEELQKTLAKPFMVFSRIEPNAGWYRVK